MEHGNERAEFWKQVEACQFEIQPGPERKIKWGVPDGRRNPATGSFVHDDLLMPAALCSVLDGVSWGGDGGTGDYPEGGADGGNGEGGILGVNAEGKVVR